jgi:dephospho-CoA kinase
VLYVGVFGHDERRVISRLTGLGAVVCRVETPPSWDVADPSIVVLTGESSSSSVHLTVATDPESGVDAMIGATAGEIDALWHDRLVPFESNLRLGRRAPRRQTAVLVHPDPTWPEQARRLIDRLCFVDSRILRADHIGSTSVPGLPAKQLLDIQAVVADLADAVGVAEAARRAGFVHAPGPWFGTDRYGIDHPEEVVVDADPARPVNVNIRLVDGPIWRETLLFRDWLRYHDDERNAYAALKSALANQPSAHVDDYSRDKMPWISGALGRAEEWAAATNWSP